VLKIFCYRLFEKELDYIVNHAKDEYILLDLTFVDLVAKMQRKFPTVKGYIILTDRQHMPKHSKLQNMLCYEDLLQVMKWPNITSGCTVVLCCAALCCAVLCCAVLCCAVLCCAVLCLMRHSYSWIVLKYRMGTILYMRCRQR